MIHYASEGSSAASKLHVRQGLRPAHGHEQSLEPPGTLLEQWTVWHDHDRCRTGCPCDSIALISSCGIFPTRRHLPHDPIICDRDTKGFTSHRSSTLLSSQQRNCYDTRQQGIVKKQTKHVLTAMTQDSKGQNKTKTKNKNRSNCYDTKQQGEIKTNKTKNIHSEHFNC